MRERFTYIRGYLQKFKCKFICISTDTVFKSKEVINYLLGNLIIDKISNTLVNNESISKGRKV